MGRLLQAAVLVVGMVGVASAGSSRKVKVDSTPPGATVYIESIENVAACEATPCTIDVPVGDRLLIVRLDKYTPEFVQINVTKGKKPMPVSVKLTGAIGTIRIVDAPRGAVVKVNNEDKGKVGRGPMDIEAPAEPATVTITFNGKTQTEMIEVEAGGATEVAYKGGSATPTPPPNVATGGGDGDEEGDGEEGDTEEGGNEEGNTEGPENPRVGGDLGEEPTVEPRGAYVEVGVAADFGFRKFVFSNGSQPFNLGGEFVVGPAVELWPGRVIGVHALRGLSLFGRVQFAATHQQVTKQDMNGVVTDVGAATFSGALEVSLRQKFQFGPGGVVGVEASAGYVRDQLEFSADNQTAFAMVPSADYKSIRIGARISYVAKFEPFIGAENRIVLDGGDLANRGDSADASGYHFGLGIKTRLGPLAARAELSYAKYSWAFTNPVSPGADGAEDSITWVGAVIGYAY